jgi:hypothetical protein
VKLYDPNDPEQRVAIERRQERWAELRVWACIALFVAIVGTVFVGNQLWYGDWRCAFVNCVRTQDIKAVPK